MEIKVIENINKDLFNINDNNNMPAFALSINNIYYQISGFNNAGNEYIYYGEYSPNKAVNLAVSFINNISFKILIRIYDICSKLKADINEINIFHEKNINGRKSFETLEKSLTLPENLIDFVDKKDIPLKTVSLIISQQENVLNFINGAVIHNEFSMQSFRKFVEKVCDFKEIIPENYNKDFTFPDVKSASHKEIDGEYNKLISNFKNIKINNLDSFESPKLNFSFDISSIEDYENIIKLLHDNKNNIVSFYEILEKYGLK